MSCTKVSVSWRVHCIRDLFELVFNTLSRVYILASIILIIVMNIECS